MGQLSWDFWHERKAAFIKELSALLTDSAIADTTSKMGLRFMTDRAASNFHGRQDTGIFAN
jgi:hypothetical protein